MVRLLRAKVSACDVSASSIVGFDLVVRNASYLVCHRQCGGEDNSWDMVACPRVCERTLWNSLAYCIILMTKWFYSTRLETRTKESNIFASSWVEKPTCEMKVTTEMLASEAD